jgi:hypothetical protein
VVKVGAQGLCQNLLGGFAFLGTYSAQADVGLIVNLHRERDRFLGNWFFSLLVRWSGYRLFHSPSESALGRSCGRLIHNAVNGRFRKP